MESLIKQTLRWVQIFRSFERTSRTHSKGYVEDLSIRRARKGCTNAVLNLSVLP